MRGSRCRVRTVRRGQGESPWKQRVAKLSTKASVPPALCVVIPTRDRAATVAEAVASVLTTRRSDIQVVVVDDGSCDDTPARLAEISDPRLTFRKVAPGGANRARNIGAAASAASLIAFLDSDDAFAPGRVERLIAFFATHPRVDCLIDGFVDISPSRTRVHRMPRSTPRRADIRRLLLAHQLPLSNSAITVRRQAWETVRGHDEGLVLHDDRDFLLRLAVSHELRFGQATDLIKRRGPHSISHRAAGYIAGLDALVARYPDYYRPEYADTFRYLIVRGIMTSLSRGHFVSAFRELCELQAAPHLPRDFLYSVGRYWSGRRQRLMAMATAMEPAEGASADWVDAETRLEPVTD